MRRQRRAREVAGDQRIDLRVEVGQDGDDELVLGVVLQGGVPAGDAAFVGEDVFAAGRDDEAQRAAVAVAERSGHLREGGGREQLAAEERFLPFQQVVRRGQERT